jgi:hypothetical protein
MKELRSSTRQQFLQSPHPMLLPGHRTYLPCLVDDGLPVERTHGEFVTSW